MKLGEEDVRAGLLAGELLCCGGQEQEVSETCGDVCGWFDAVGVNVKRWQPGFFCCLAQLLRSRAFRQH